MKRKYFAIAFLFALITSGASESFANSLRSVASEPITSPCSQDLNINDNYQRKVLLLSIPDDQSDPSKYATDTDDTDLALVNFLCHMDTPTFNSISVEVFAGSDDQGPMWPDLDLYTDIVIPASTSATTSIMDDTSIWTYAIQEDLKTWVEGGGHLHVLGIYEQQDLLAEMMESNLSFNVPSQNSTAWVAHQSDQNFKQVPDLPYEIVVNCETPLLSLEFFNEINEFGILSGDLFFQDSVCSGVPGVAAGLVQVGYGQIALFSTKLFNLLDFDNGYGLISESESKNRWFKVVGASMAGHLSSNISLDVGLEYSSVGTSVVGGENGLLYRAFDSALSVQLGEAHETRTIPCINTLKNPSLVRQDALGIWLICGQFHVDDGTSEEGYEARLIRWFSKDSNWIRTTVEFNFRHLPEISLKVGLFNDYGSDQYTLIDKTNTGFPYPLSNFYYVEEELIWFTVSADPNLEANPNLENAGSIHGSSFPVVLNFTPEEGTFGYGGLNSSEPEELSGIYGGGDAYRVNRSQTVIQNYLDLAGDGASSISWYTAVLDFELGCDVNTSALAEQIADVFVDENLGNGPYDYGFINSTINQMSSLITSGDVVLPELVSDCIDFPVSTAIEIENLESDSAEIHFDSVLGADWYELQLFNDEFQTWDPIESEWSTGYWLAELTDLVPDTNYKARMRAWQVEGDLPNQWASHSAWATEEFQTPAQVLPTPQPSVSTQTVYIDKPVEVIYVPKIVYVPTPIATQVSESKSAQPVRSLKRQTEAQYSKLESLLFHLISL